MFYMKIVPTQTEAKTTSTLLICLKVRVQKSENNYKYTSNLVFIIYFLVSNKYNFKSNLNTVKPRYKEPSSD